MRYFKLTITVLIGMIVLASCSTSEQKKYTPSVGDIVQLAPENETVIVAFTESDLKLAIDSIRAKDSVGYNQLILEKKILSLQKGIKARVLDDGLAAKIRLIEGSHENEVVWTDRGWLKPAN